MGNEMADDESSLRPTEDESSESDRKGPEDKGPKDVQQIADEGVQKAIKGLARVEKRLMRAVKIQKMEVQKSNVPQPKDGPADDAFKLRQNRSVAESATTKRPSKPRKKLPVADGTAGAEYAHDEASEDGEYGAANGAPESGEVAADKGAGRPPPINSDYLPLPWKGRLGYVSGQLQDFSIAVGLYVLIQCRPA
jgi:UV DNA damage endonuclease